MAASSATKKTTAKVVNCNSLYKRSGAGTNYKIKGSLKKGYSGTVTTSKKVGNTRWYKWKDGTWSSGKYLKITTNKTGAANGKGKITGLDKKNDKKSNTKKKTKSLVKNIKDKPVAYGSIGDSKGTSYAQNGTKHNSVSSSETKESERDAEYQRNKNLSALLDIVEDYDGADWLGDEIKNLVETGSTGYINGKLSNARQLLSLPDENGKIDGEDVHVLFHTKFNRFKLPYPDEALNKSFGFVFFTRPSLWLLDSTGNIADRLKGIPEYVYMYKTSPHTFEGLTRGYSTDHEFHTLLSNMVTSFDLSDQSIETSENGESLTGHKILYGGADTKSKTGGTFNVNFVDNRCLDIYRALYLWEKYISDEKRGIIRPSRAHIKEKVLDYAASAYYFLVAPDDNKIIYWTKYFGVFPTTTPGAEFSWKKESLMATPDYSIPFAFSFKEDYDIFTLSEFNMLSSGDFTYLDTYSEDALGAAITWVGAPFVETKISKSGIVSYHLRFRPK